MTPNLTFDELFNILTHDTIDGLGNRLGGTATERQMRAGVAQTSIAAFQPRDGTEIMLACKAVTFGTLGDDALYAMGLATSEADRERAEKQVTAMGRMHMSYVKAIQAHRAELARREKAQKAEPQAKPAPPAEPTPKTIIIPPSAPPAAAPNPTAAPPSHPAGARVPPVPTATAVVARIMGT